MPNPRVHSPNGHCRANGDRQRVIPITPCGDLIGWCSSGSLDRSGEVLKDELLNISVVLKDSKNRYAVLEAFLLYEIGDLSPRLFEKDFDDGLAGRSAFVSLSLDDAALLRPSNLSVSRR